MSPKTFNWLIGHRMSLQIRTGLCLLFIRHDMFAVY